MSPHPARSSSLVRVQDLEKFALSYLERSERRRGVRRRVLVRSQSRTSSKSVSFVAVPPRARTSHFGEHFSFAFVRGTCSIPIHTSSTCSHSLLEKGSVESTHKVPTSNYYAKHCHAACLLPFHSVFQPLRVAAIFPNTDTEFLKERLSRKQRNKRRDTRAGPFQAFQAA